MSPTRSGSPASLVPWETLGKEGRRFVAAGRDPAQLGAAAGRPACEPVRAYVGLESAPDPQARADLAVAELDRDRRLRPPVHRRGHHDRHRLGRRPAPTRSRRSTAATPRSSPPSTPTSELAVLPLDRSRRRGRGPDCCSTPSTPGSTRSPPGSRGPGCSSSARASGRRARRRRSPRLADIRAPTPTGCCGSARRTPTGCGAVRRAPRPGHPRGRPVYADGLVVRFTGGRADPWAAAHALVHRRASSTCSTPPTRSSGGRRPAVGSAPTGSSSRAATTCSAP